jgi:cbb3-type cytochrome oxidase subunit 3
VSFFYEGINSFGLIVFFGEIFLAIVLIMAHKKRKNEIPYF